MAPPADIAVTILFDPYEGLVDLADAMRRLSAAAAAAGFAIDRHAIANDLQAATFRHTVPGVVRILASPGGSVAIEVRDRDPATPPVAAARKRWL